MGGRAVVEDLYVYMAAVDTKQINRQRASERAERYQGSHSKGSQSAAVLSSMRLAEFDVGR